MEYDHLFHRDADPFKRIIAGEKRFEIRLLDEKRKKVKIGDQIKGVLRDDKSQFFISQVTGLSYFDNFDDVFYAFKDEISSGDQEILQRVYNPKKVSELGIVIIHFRILKTNTNK